MLPEAHMGFDERLLKRVADRLAALTICGATKQDTRRVDDFFSPRVGARGHKGQRLPEHQSPRLQLSRSSN